MLLADERLDAVLERHASALGEDFVAYRNHAYRVANLCLVLHPCEGAARAQIVLAAACHDIGIWTAGTYDYLAPSAEVACQHLACIGQQDWQAPVTRMIHEHHKLRRFGGEHAELVEPFRRADWIDVSRGVLSFGLPRALLRAIFARWPNAGFHRRLVQLTLREARAHPLRPLPVLKW